MFAVMIEFYGYKKCQTSNKIESYLKNKNIEYQFIDILEKPPSKTLLQTIMKEKQIEPKAFINNCSAPYREMKLKDKLPTMNKDEVLKLLIENPKLFKRPLVVDKTNKKYTIGNEALKEF
ncbi:MAG: Spx/MgsR family RNA polymerase-binding regulatory protein [Leptospiraceae bacterium]|nr:Spx/MgsR family RNA polymerase-binding regulatory protein [Leptospiraceae bacterium]MDW7976623.1 Spx/MgsR family RNA polymerase-binding regulatory protein [Leptospiraceae bacterium]